MLTEALATGGEEAKRAFDTMMGTRNINVAAIGAARLTSENAHSWFVVCRMKAEARSAKRDG
jgi:hypothetical protein